MADFHVGRAASRDWTPLVSLESPAAFGRASKDCRSGRCPGPQSDPTMPGDQTDTVDVAIRGRRKTHAGRGFLNDYQQLWDLEMWYHLLEQGKFVYLAEPLCAFRQHSAQQSNVNRRAGIGPNEMLLLLETYYARPWLRAIATQR